MKYIWLIMLIMIDIVWFVFSLKDFIRVARWCKKGGRPGMRCPYQTRVIHKPPYTDTDGYVNQFSTEITEFGECLKDECPFYCFKPGDKVERCRRAEGEIHKYERFNE